MTTVTDGPSTRRTRWAVLGPGVISGYFAHALRRSTSGALLAVGSRDRGRARAFADEHGAAVERHLRRDPAARRRRRRVRGHRAHHPRRAGDRRARGRQGRALREARHPDSVRHPSRCWPRRSGWDCRSWRRTSTASDRSPPGAPADQRGRDRSAAARRCLLRRGGDRTQRQAVRTRAGRRGDPRRRRLSGLARGRGRHLVRTGHHRHPPVAPVGHRTHRRHRSRRVDHRRDRPRRAAGDGAHLPGRRPAVARGDPGLRRIRRAAEHLGQPDRERCRGRRAHARVRRIGSPCRSSIRWRPRPTPSRWPWPRVGPKCRR